MEQGGLDAVSETTVTEAKPPRRAWVAALLSFILPGLGQWYSTRIRRGVGILAVYVMVAGLALGLMGYFPLAGIAFVLPLLLLFGFQAFSMVDAARCARRIPPGSPIPLTSRWYGCLAAFVVSISVVFPLWAAYGMNSWVRTFRIPTGGMEPTVRVGDCVIATNWTYNLRAPLTNRTLWVRRAPTRGEIITFLFPEDAESDAVPPQDRSRMFMKRVIGSPGETVEMRNRTVYVDGKALVEPYAEFVRPEGESRNDWGPETVPPDSFFVLGDNRDNSRDSRHWGYVPRDDIFGRVTVVYWSQDQSGEARFERIGHRLY